MTEEAERESSGPVAVIKETICVERRDGAVTLRLLDAALWQAFRQEGTEMIITKAGRRMFPFVMVTVEGVSPTLLYSVHLSLVPYDNRQYKFCQRRWVSVSETAPGSTIVPEQSYMHPASPNRGSFWSQEMISFAKLKITNNKHSQGDIVLQSMRKYMAQITIREELGDTQYVFTLPETTFVAVTQYQNEAVTRMKIAHNPFANGFKSENGKKQLFSKSDLSRSQDSKQKIPLSGSKSNTKTARVKATVTPQTLAQVLPMQQGEEDMDVTEEPPCLTLPKSVQPLHHMSPLFTFRSDADTISGLSLHPEPSFFPGGFPMPRPMAISPYTFQAEDSETILDVQGDFGVNNVDVERISPDTEGCSPKSGDCYSKPDQCRQRQNWDDEDRDEFVTRSSSPANAASPSTIPTVIRDSEDSLVGEDLRGEPVTSCEEDNSLGDQPLFSSVSSPSTKPLQNSSQLALGSASNTTKKAETFKHPLPKKSTHISKKHPKRPLAASEGSSGGENDVDMHWYRNAIRQAREKQQDCWAKEDRGVQLKLHDGHLWQSFATCGSKMVISSEGRKMFPVVSVTLRGLDPGRLYSVWLHLSATDDMMYSFPREHSVWGPLYPTRRSTAPVKPYMHPSSPMRGLAWMKVKVTFDDVRLTSLPLTEDGSLLSLQSGRRYFTQVVVREEEETTPNGSGSTGNIFFFPFQELTFFTKQESDDVKSSLPVAPPASHSSDLLKRSRGNTDELKDDDSEGSEGKAKVARLDPVNNSSWLRAAAVQPRSSEVSGMLPRAPDLSAVLPRPSDLCTRLNSLYCFPPVSTLQPAHVGVLANRMPLPVTSPLQSIPSLPFPPQLLPQLRTPMHSAFGLAFPPFNPLPYFYYPYSVPAVTPTSSVSDVCKGLDLSLKTSDSR